MRSRIKIAIMGLNFGQHIIRELQKKPGMDLLEIAAVCDMDEKRLRAVADPLGVPGYRSLDELLKVKEISAIGLYTGPEGRAKLIRKIIRAGKHVMTTKPLELDSDEALSVLREAQKLGMVVHLNSPAPVPSKDLLQIRDWQKRYKLGRPVGCHAEVWASYAEKADGSWYDDPKRCPVAPIYRLGIYLINDLTWLFGDIVDVQVMESRIRTGRPTADNAQLSIAFQNGAMGNVFASFCVDDGDEYRNGMTLHFENGTVYRNVGPGRSEAVCRLSLIQRVKGARCCTAEVELDTLSGKYQWDTFCRRVRGGAVKNELTPEQIVAGIRVIERMVKR